MPPAFKFPTAEEISRAVQSIHDRPEKVVIAVTGGFAGLQQLLWETAGASRTLVEASMPYDKAAFAKYIGKVPTQFCSVEASLELAKASYERGRAHALANGDVSPVLGLGATAALATDRVRKGACRYHVAVVGDGVGGPVSLSRVSPEGLTRMEQGRLSDIEALNALLEAMGMEILKIPGLNATPDAGWEAWTVIWPDGRRSPVSELDPNRYLLLPGSFNPLHEGHLKSAEAAERQTGKHVIFLLEGGPHPVKGPIDDAEIGRRMGQFVWKVPVMVTRGAPLYHEKAVRLPGFGFVVGADTMRRICDPSYHKPSFWGDVNEPLGGPDWFLTGFRDSRTRFYVFDRIDGERLRTLDDIAMPAWLRQLCTRLEGRWDVSSTELRARGAR